ncbi:DnaB-like helicase C-terminal domain-containing protein [Mycoplasma tauri]|uniref:DnaB-like helicase C-terminal domain-containing protein n=1 Tax=Mycoplasma tauri TaxID=547987 RepID=UPI001CBDF463|nr:DnaB-like helicase C-terminal domain-containing protein [Mycoplasma tauri]MBZ4203394.1 repb [Mycoplasma tauri]
MINELLNFEKLSNKFNDLIKNNKNKIKPLKTNFFFIDENIGGLQPRQIYFLASRPGVGKTAFLLNLINNVLKQIKENEYLLFFSLEVSALDIYKKFLALNSKISINLTDCENLDVLPQIEEAQSFLMNKNLLIFDIDEKTNNELTTEKISEIIQTFNSKNPGKVIKAIFIDYFQILDLKGNGLEYEKLAKASRQLRRIAKFNNLNMFVLSQLSREYDKKQTNLSPTFSDLKGSGNIEQDADVIMFLYEPQQEIISNLREPQITIAKNRNGRTSTTQLKFNDSIGLFYESQN